MLKNEKAWQKHFSGYIFRPQRLQMALSVADSFRGKQAVFIEAPTGSGKALAYLLAALITSLPDQPFFINLARQLPGDQVPDYR